MNSAILGTHAFREFTPPGVAELCDLAATGLIAMLDPEKQMFCHIFGRNSTCVSRRGLSPRYTLISLLGLKRYERSGRRSPIAIRPVLDALLKDRSWITNTGDLGLLLWTCAELLPNRLAQVYDEVRAKHALTRFPDGVQGRTMEVAWYLTGLATCCLSGHADLPGLAEQMAAARGVLERNCGSAGIYGHLRSSLPVRQYVRRRIGTFADQVYPTIALARLSRVLHDDRTREMALRTARTMCRLQLEHGEWSWRYDASSGRVVSRYPVYSVHQHAMGPMMLHEAGEANGWDFSEAIYKSLAWVLGVNELGRNFIEPSLGLIWRCIYLEPINACTDAALRIVHLRQAVSRAGAKVRYECRPYELGWLLYAFAGKEAI